MTISVRTLFFAAYRDLVRTPSSPWRWLTEPPWGSGGRAARARGPFADLPPDPAVAVNRVYAGPSQALGEGDEVAFIPPVAGG